MKRFLSAFGGLVFAASPALAQQLAIPPETAGNTHECFNSDGDGASCNHKRSGSWITGDSDGVDDVAVTDEGSVIIPTGSFRKHVVDYRVHFNQSDAGCEAAPIVETPHHAPYVLEFSRWFRTRATMVDHGLTRGWKDNYLYILNVSQASGFRTARFEVPNGTEMNWIDIGSTGTWTDDNAGLQSMVLALTDEPGDKYLVTDRWGGKYHFVPNTTPRAALQYLLDWLEDENGNRITLTYGADGYPRTAADGFGRVIRYSWGTGSFNGTKHILGVELPNGRTLGLQYYFDGLRTYRVTYPNGEVAAYGRGVDADGDYWSFADPLGEPGVRKQRVYTYGFGPGFEYDTGRVRGIKDESGHVQLVRHEDAIDPRITIEYDDGRGFAYDCAFGGLNETITNLRTGAVTTNEWQANGGLLKKKIDPLGAWTTADYDDDLALRILRGNPDGSFETWSHGPHNRVVDYVDPNGNPLHDDHDVRGNLLRRTYADASFEEWTRHTSGRVTAYRDRNGRVTTYSYDSRGNVAQIVRPAEGLQASPVTAFTYDVDGRVLTRVDPLGRTTTYQYDLLGRRVATLHPGGTSELVTYGAMTPANIPDPVGTAGLVVERVDRDGHATTLEYGPNDRLVGESGAPGEIVYQYDAQDRLASRTENGDVESFTYDSSARIETRSRVVDATHVHTWTYAYDLRDRIVLEIDPLGLETQMTWTHEGQLSSRTRQLQGALYAFVAYTHDPNGNVTAIDDGEVRTYEYDSNDRLVKECQPAPFDGDCVQYAYDFEGNLVSRTDQGGNATIYAYTNRGMRSFEIDPTGVVLSHDYFLDDALKQTLAPATNGKRDYTYDSAGRQASEKIAVDGGSADMLTSVVRDGRGNVIESVDGEGGVQLSEYDARGRLIRAVDALGEETLTVHTDDGAPLDGRLAAGQGSAVSVTDPLGRTTTSVYDGVGRLIRTVDPAGASTVYEHDVPSGPFFGTRRTNRLGHTSGEYRDGAGHVTRVVDELGNTTNYTYGTAGELVGMQDARGNTSVFQRDVVGRLEEVAYPGSSDVVSYGYDARGLVTQRTDQDGAVTEYVYDGAGRITSIEYPDASLDTYQYDLGGRLISASSGRYGNTVTRSYDRADRVEREVLPTGEVRRRYDRRSLVTRITTPSGRAFERTYTARGELDTVSLGAAQLVDHAYDDAGGLVQALNGNGTSSTWSHGVQGWISDVEHVHGATDVLHLTYSRDAEGKVLTRRNRTNISRHEFSRYDAAERLISFQGKVPPVRRVPPLPGEVYEGVSFSIGWGLDPVGNWATHTRNGIAQVRQHSAANELVSISGFGVLDYDKRGNLVDDGVFHYAYDFNDRLREIRVATNDDLIASYEYDALGRRLQRNAFDNEVIAQRRFLYSYAGEQIVEIHEQPAVGSPVFLAAFATGAELDHPLVMVRANHSYWYHHDAAGSTVALTNETGAVAERYEYDPHGRTQVMDASWQNQGDTSVLSNPFTFQGRENDSEAGLIHFRTRHLSPVYGRFLQRNSIGYAGGTNLYSAACLVNGHSPFGNGS